MASGDRKTSGQGLWVKGTYFDYPSLFLIIFLTFFGYMMVYSASSFVANRDMGSSTYFLRRQFFIGLGGYFLMWLFSRIRYQIFKKLTTFMMLGEAVLLIGTFFFGKTTNGSTRWIYIGPVGFQPSEIAKFVVIIYMAYACTYKSSYLKDLWGTVKVFIPAVGLVGIIAIENLSTAIICAMIAVCIWFVATPKPGYLFYMGIGGAVFLIGMILLQGYRSSRFKNWIDVWKGVENSDGAYQTLQGLYAIGSGGIFGRGLGQSIQKLGFIPEAQNDMIFSIICEELGLFGGIGLIIVFLLLIWRFRFIAEGAPDRFGSFIVVGAIAHIACQVLVNIAVVTNVFPNTGVTLPFISYGGTSLMFLLVEMGVVLSVSRQIVPLEPGSE